MIAGSIIFNILIILSFLFPAVLLLLLVHMFLGEKERKAAHKSLALAILLLLAGVVVFIFELDFIVYLTLAVYSFIFLLFIFPFKVNHNLTDDIPVQRVDERDIIFSRKELVPGSKRYNDYYKKHPASKIPDDEFRALPGLLSPLSKYYNEEAFNIADQYFVEVHKLRPRITGEVSPNKSKNDTAGISRELKAFAKELGALETGITETRPYHFYTHKGRGKEYNRIIENKDSYAFAFTVEMNHEMVGAAPHASIVMESARQYLNAGTIAIKIAEHIRSMGYAARAHIDGNYELICPIVARDAGLGEIGRMGLLMTPKQGPRVRIAVVTTEMELLPDRYKKNHTAIDFCNMCRKCAVCCPGNSIPHGSPELIGGVKRWQINSVSCFTFWCKAGTDCGRCMSVCPYSHPDNFLHNISRWGIQHSKFFRYLAVQADDFFYGRKPAPRQMPAHQKRRKETISYRL